MGLIFPAIEVIHELSKNLPDSKKVLCFSYPDIIAEPLQIQRLFGRKDWVYRKDSSEIIEWHKCKNISQIVDTTDFFEKIGFTPVYADLVKARANEVIVDLNCSLEKIDEFDLVIDNVMHHCMNIGMALLNIINNVKVGGYVMHVNPLTMINSGFFNICPQFYFSFYTPQISGFDIANYKICHVKGTLLSKNLYPPNPFKRARNISDDYIQIVVAKKLEDKQDIVWPIQMKFQKYPSSKII